MKDIILEDIVMDIILPIVFGVIVCGFLMFICCVMGKSNESRQEKSLETDVYSVETYKDTEYDITYIILKDRLGDVIRADVMIEEE